MQPPVNTGAATIAKPVAKPVFKPVPFLVWAAGFVFYLGSSVTVFVFAFVDARIKAPLLNFFTAAICVVGSVKAIRRLVAYKKHSAKNPVPQAELRTRYFEGVRDKSHYIKYRITILVFSLGFFTGCVLTRFLAGVPAAVYLSGVFFLFALDILFITRACFLNTLVNLLFRTPLRCCSTCPIRGWDILLLMAPILLVIGEVMLFNVILVTISVALAVISLIYWEAVKFGVISAKRKCGSCEKKNTKCAIS